MSNLYISKKDKKKLGIIIAYLRKNQYSKIEPLDWTSEDFVVDDFGESICSRKTLSKIENKEIILDDNIYDNLLKKLGLKYNYDGIIEKDKLNHLSKNLINAMQYMDEEEEKQIIRGILEIYKSYDLFAIESIIYNTLKLLFTNNKKEINEETLKDFKLLYDIYPPSIQMALRRISIFYCYEHGNKSLLNELSERFMLPDLISPLDKFLFIIVLRVNKKYITAIEELTLLKGSSKKDGNNRLEIECLIQLADFARILNSEELGEMSLRLEKSLNDLEINYNLNKLGTIYYNLGLFFEESNMPQYALNNYLKSISLNEDLFLRVGCQVFNLCTKSKLKIPKDFVRRNYFLETIPYDISSNEDIFLILYNYYLRKYDNKSPIILEDYITSNIVNLFKEASDIDLYEIFEKELMELVDKTGNKNKLYNLRRLKNKKAKEE